MRSGCAVKGENWVERKQHWFARGTHSNLRITRILKSLSALGLQHEAQAFLACLTELRESEPDCQLNVGADAFTRLWSQTHGQRWLAKLLRLPVLKQLTHLAYNVFARLLYRWNRAKGRW